MVATPVSCWSAVTLVAVLLLPGAALRAQQEVRIGGDATLTIRGILSGTVFAQDARFLLGNGQQSQFVQAELADWWHGGDVRSTRLTFDFRGPRVGNSSWRANATLEADFFGPFNGTGNFADEQPIPRLRLAYADLTNGMTTLRVGQAWSLTLGNIPVSTSHIGFPLGWGSGGFIGWRFPGIFLIQSLTDTDAATQARLSFAALRGSWSDEPAPDQPSAGEAGTPQLEAALNLDGRFTGGSWGAYFVGHWDRKNLNGVRPEDTPEPPENDLDSWALQGGLRLQSGAITLHGNAYSGKAMGHHFAHVIQFGDVEGWGAWAQIGVDFTRRWGVWLYYGMDDPDDEDVRASGLDRLSSWLFVPMLRYRAGPYSLGLEWLHNRTDYSIDAATSQERTGNQILFSTRFDF